MKLTKKQIRELSAMQLTRRVTRLQFDDEAGSAMIGDSKEIMVIEKELKKRLIKMLGHDPYPPNKIL